MFNQPRNKSVSQSHFAMIPRNDVPRSVFRNRSAHKTTFNAGDLIPVYLNEILPGDSVRMSMTSFTRVSPLVYPLMDNLYMDSFWFFVPARILWENWNKFMGERTPTPSSSIDFTVPVMDSGAGGAGLAVGSLADFFGLPSADQITGSLSDINALPFRAYQLIYAEWFRDQNLQDSPVHATFFGDGPDPWSGVGTPNVIRQRGKRHDYFTSCLPWPLKSANETPIGIPLSGLAPIQGLGLANAGLVVNANESLKDTARGTTTWPFRVASTANTLNVEVSSASASANPLVYADLSQATNATIEALRLAFMTQMILEKDARGGTRYTEILRSHFGVTPQDARLQRPEYLGGSSSPVSINPVAQTSETSETGTPLGNLAGVGTGVHASGFSQSFSEHGYLIGIVSVRGDLTYQQGYHRLWTRQTKYDFYWPSFAHLGEQAVLRKEIYAVGDPAFDDLVFGYQERWAEYRYFPSKVTGMFRSGITGTLDAWHLAQEFGSPPVLDSGFIVENPPMDRILAAAEEADNQQFLFDSVFDASFVRAMPTYSVPGMGSRF